MGFVKQASVKIIKGNAVDCKTTLHDLYKLKLVLTETCEKQFPLILGSEINCQLLPYGMGG